MKIVSSNHPEYKYAFLFDQSEKMQMYCQSLEQRIGDIFVSDKFCLFNDLAIVDKITDPFPMTKIDEDVKMDMDLSRTVVSPFTLRSYQSKAVEAGIKHITGSSKKGGLLVLPTGSGKSLVIASIAQSLPGKTLVLQPSKEILEQNYQKAVDFGFKDIGVFSASMNRKDIGKITFATIGTIISKRELFVDFSHLILDEAHVVNSKGGQYEDFISFFGGKCLGLTATPYRLQSFRDMRTEENVVAARLLTRTRPRIFEEILHITQVEELYNLKFLCPIKYIVNDDYNQDDIKSNSTGADFDERALAKYNHDHDLVGMVASSIRENISKHVLVFMASVDEAWSLQKELNMSGISSAIVSAKTPKKEREQIISDFKSGKIKVVTNCATMTTGFDFPGLDTVILAKPTKSVSLFAQMAGRGIRIAPDKPFARIIDICGNIKKFGTIESFKLVTTKTGLRLQSSAGYLTGVNLASDDKEDLESTDYKGKVELDSFSPTGIVNFGKYRGTHIAKVPTHYLKWCMDTFTDGVQKTQCKNELSRRNLSITIQPTGLSLDEEIGRQSNIW